MSPNSVILSVVFLLMLSISPSLESDDVMRFAKNHLKALGYLSENYTSVDDGAYDEALTSALRKYQTFCGLNVSGRIEPDTLMMMLSRPRGGVLERSSADNITPQFSFFEGNPKWPKSKRKLKYTYRTKTPIKFKNVSVAISRAFSTWSAVSQFTFKEVSGVFGSPPINIGFYKGEHGDKYPFDGYGGSYAHAFEPPSGKMHFDAEEKWGTVQAPDLLDLESIALHEIGHLLGLDHSDKESAVMYDTFGYGRVKRELDQDDIDGIRALYAD